MSATSHDLPGSTIARQDARRALSSSLKSCPKCNQPLAAEAVAGLCPKCLMGLVMTDTVGALDDLTDSSQVTSTTGGLPTQFGRYTILGQLGRGAMGVVHLAKDDELDRMVAIKVPLFGRCDEGAVYRRFQREVRAAAGLRHPNICPIYDVGQIDGTIFMSMAYIAGRPLDEFIAADKVFPIRQLAQLIRKLTAALQEAHRHGIVHRDLKPSNIMVDQRGEPLIMDFGLASRNSEDDPRVTRSGAIVGTPAYMAPEQLAGHATGPASDIYAMGVVSYELLTGRLPFEGDLVELVAQVARDQPRRPSEFRADVPSQLDEICLRALAKKPEDRFASMGDFAQALGQFLADSATPDAATPPPDQTVPEPGRSARWWQHVLAAVGGLTLAACGVAVVCLLASLDATNPRTAIATVNAGQQPDVPRATATRPVTGQAPTTGSNGAEAEDEVASAPATHRTNGSLAALPRGEGGPVNESESSPRMPDGSQPTSEPAIVGTPAPFAAVGSAPSAIASNRVAVSAVGTDAVGLETSKEAESKPSPPLSESPKSKDDARDVFFQKSLAQLRGIAFERRKLIDETRQAIARHDLELPDAFVKERGQLAALNRRASELRSEFEEAEFGIREMNIENSRRDLNLADRLSNTAAINRLRQLQAIKVKQLNALGSEVLGKQRTIANLQKEQLAIASEAKRRVAEASKLLERAFWAAEPTGAFSQEQYRQISALIGDWLRDGTAEVEVRAMQAITLANAGSLEEARAAASQAAANNSQSALAAAALGYVKSKSGQPSEGLRDLSRATRLSKRFATAFLLRGMVNSQLLRHDAALQDLQRVAALDPKNLSATRLLAMQFAASPVESQRDPDKAVALAKAACDMTEFMDWQSLDVLAAASASSGNFAKAVETQRAALELCPDRELAGGRARLAMYQEDRVFRLK